MTEFVTTAAGDIVAYDHRGPDSGAPTVLFVSGAGPHRATDPITAPTAELLAADGGASIVYDRLGRGESLADGAITLAREVAAITALAALSDAPIILCGHSSGCSIALAAAASGVHTAGIVLWEPPFKGPDGGSHEWSQEFIRRVESGDPEGAQVQYMKDMPPEWLEGARSSPAWPAIVAQVGSLRPDAESLAWAESEPFDMLLSGIHAPIEVLIGEQTMPIMEAASDQLAATVPGLTAKRMPGANHAWEPQPMAAELARVARAVTIS